MVMHGSIILALLWHWHNNVLTIQSGTTQKTIRAYIYQKLGTADLLKSPTTAQTKTRKSINKLSSKVDTINKSTENTPTNHQPSSDTSTNNINGTNEDALLNLLHHAIQAQQQYPRDALMQGHKGTTTVAFDLYPDGHIENCTVFNTSGASSLDEAAVEAVNAAAPIEQAKRYLEEVKHFIIKVNFK